MTAFTFNTTDFNTPDSTANLWYTVGSDEYAISFTGITDDTQGNCYCNISLLDNEGCPLNETDTQHVSMFNDLKNDAIKRLADELDADQIARINAESLAS